MRTCNVTRARHIYILVKSLRAGETLSQWRNGRLLDKHLRGFRRRLGYSRNVHVYKLMRLHAANIPLQIDLADQVSAGFPASFKPSPPLPLLLARSGREIPVQDVSLGLQNTHHADPIPQYRDYRTSFSSSNENILPGSLNSDRDV